MMSGVNRALSGLQHICGQSRLRCDACRIESEVKAEAARLRQLEHALVDEAVAIAEHGGVMEAHS
jgi:hypothetical protein